MIVATTRGDLDVSHAAPGRRLLRWWFPRAATPHCTAQARALHASWAALAGQGLDVVGLSFDALPDLTAWALDLGIDYPLAHGDVDLADHLGAARPVGDPWREALPRRVFDVVDDAGVVLARQDVPDAAEFLEQVQHAMRGPRP